MCPLGIGNIDGPCRFHVPIDKMPKDGLCPTHKKKLEKTTKDEDRITVTVMGEEDIEKELDPNDARPMKKGRMLGGADGGNEDEKKAYREERKKDIEEAILSARELEDTE